VTSRRAFDGALLAAAQHAGATLIPERVVSVAGDGHGWTATTRSRQVKADWLLGADGANSLVRRTVWRPFARRELSIATGYFLHGVTARDVVVVFEDSPPGYLWCFPRPDHLAIGVSAQANGSSAGELRARVEEWIGTHVTGSGELRRYSWPIPSLTESELEAEPIASKQWMLLGDAAGLVDSITGEGIYFALQSAEYAAESVLRQGDAAGAFVERVREEIHGELVRAARFRTRFYRPRFTALLIRALERSAPIRAVMADLVAGRQPYRGLRRRLIETLELRMMLDLF
jgi:flavin-dependent dehydrogenase